MKRSFNLLKIYTALYAIITSFVEQITDGKQQWWQLRIRLDLGLILD